MSDFNPIFQNEKTKAMSDFNPIFQNQKTKAKSDFNPIFQNQKTKAMSDFNIIFENEKTKAMKYQTFAAAWNVNNWGTRGGGYGQPRTKFYIKFVGDDEFLLYEGETGGDGIFQWKSG